MATQHIKSLNLQELRLDETTKNRLGGFYCGNETIDRYLREDARGDCYTGKGVTYLFVDMDFGTLVAYYTLATKTLRTADDKREYASVELKMFAVNKEYQDTKCASFKDLPVSAYILDSIVVKMYDLSQEVIGFEYIVLFSTEEAVDFYEKSGFRRITDYLVYQEDFAKGCVPMYLSLYGA